MKIRIRTALAIVFALPFIGGCWSHEESQDSSKTEQAATEQEPESVPQPPAPPVFETFDGAPALSLFARLGDYRPENDDEVTLPFWKTYQEHLVKTSGVVYQEERGNRAYSFRSIRGIDSVGFFSPLSVEPATTYRVSFKIKTDLPEGGTAGIGVIEYDRFLWVAEQYPQSLDEKHRTGQQGGVSLQGKNDWAQKSFVFTTFPDTRMIHLILFREGTPDRTPIVVDDILIEQKTAQQ